MTQHLETALPVERTAPVDGGGTAGALEPVYGGLARLAAANCRASFASVVLSGCGQAWSTASTVLPEGAAPPRDPFFRHALREDGPFEVPDTAQDGRFREPFTLNGAVLVRAYAGYPLRTAAGDVLGVLAVYFAVPRTLSAGQRTAMQLLVEQALSHAELRGRLSEFEMLADSLDMPATLPSDAAMARALIESAPIAIYHVDAASSIGYVNSEYRRIFRLSPGQSADDWANNVHPEDRQRVESVWADFCRKPRPIRFEYRTSPSNGVARYFAEQVVPANSIHGYVGTISDFTDLVAARDSLRKAETLFQHTVDQAPVGIAFTDRNGRFLRCNRAFCTLLGFDPADLSDKSVGELTCDEDRAATARDLERLWKGEIEALDLEKRYVRKDGAELWVRVTTALVRAEDSTPECAVEFLRDITVRKEMAAALLQQRTLLEAVITDLPVALIACDVNGRITHYNRAAVELHCVLEAPEPSVRQMCQVDGITPVAADDHPLMRALRGETISNLELTIVPQAAAPRTTLSSARRLSGPRGQTLGAVAVIQDTTERKQAELELERVHKQLVTASRQAGMAEVATNVLHNVGNILNSINISASLLAERTKQSKASGIARLAAMLQEKGAGLAQFIATDERGRRIPEYLSSLGQQLTADQQMALQELGSLRENLELIKDTVTMQQSYAKLCGVTETVAVADLVEDSLRLNAGAFARHGVSLRREYTEVPPIVVDKHKVLQILVNLVRNAKYACDDSGKSEKLLTLRVEPAGAGVRISVIDNGIGIPAENMSRLFTHGFTTRKDGHGFGLHSGALAAQELGGSLRATSDGPGTGAAFILELPLAPR